MENQMRWRDLLGYFRTWSSLHKYHTLYPEDLTRTDTRFPEDLEQNRSDPMQTNNEGASGGYGSDDIDVSGGDIAVRFWKDLREEVRNQGGQFGVDELVVVEWPIAMLLAKRS